MARVRMVDIAKKVGVSTKTVSNVVNGSGWVGDAVRAQVLQAIDELGYRPNLAARQLRSGSSGLLGLCVPNLKEPYFAEFASEFVSAARERGLTVLVTQSKGERSEELAILESVNLPALDGLVFSPLTLTTEDVENRLSKVPMVFIGEHGERITTGKVTHVGPDNVAAAKAATQHLISQGRTRIAVIGIQNTGIDSTAKVRFTGYEEALKEAHIDVDPELLVETTAYNRAAGSQGIEQLIEQGVQFDGVFCFNDTLAFGALHTLGMHGVKVPQDVLVVGYDNIDESRFTVPPLTTIDPGIAASSHLILDLLTKPSKATAGHITVPFELITR